MSSGRVVLNKHYNNSSQITRDKFVSTGEIIISNEPGFEAIYLINTRDEVVKISSVAISGSTTPDEIKDFLRENYLTSAQTVEYVNAVEQFLNERINIISASTPEAVTDEHIREIASLEVVKVIDSADTRFDTLREIAEWIINDTTGAAKMANDIVEISAATTNNEEELVTLREYIDEQISNVRRSGDHQFLTRAQYDELLASGSVIIDGKMVQYSDDIYYCIYEGETDPESGGTVYTLSGNMISFLNIEENDGFITLNAPLVDGFIDLDSITPIIPTNRSILLDEDNNVVIEAIEELDGFINLNDFSVNENGFIIA